MRGLVGTAWCHLVALIAAADATVPPFDGAATPPPPACNSSAETDTDVAMTCADFCAGKCSFRNASSGAPADQGVAINLTLYRLTPVGVLGIANRNTGDPPGDVGFFLSRKTLAAECAKDPSNIRCFLNGINLYGKFEVEVDGAFGPYHMCNPTQGLNDTIDANWVCYQYCETPPQCDSWASQHDTRGWQGPLCYCSSSGGDSSGGGGRGNRTVGRVHRTSYHGHSSAPPKWWPAEQCAAEGLVPAGGYCINGTAYKTLAQATPAQCCAACSADECVGWGMQDGLDAQGQGTCKLMASPMRYHRLTDPSSSCISAYKEHHHGGISGGVLGGYWYSTPAAGECQGDTRPGDRSGCTWRVVAAEKYANASCVNAKVDAAVEAYNSRCFGRCPGGASNTTSDCYLACYDQAINGGGKPPVVKMPTDQVTAPWVTAMSDADVAHGGCPAVHP